MLLLNFYEWLMITYLQWVGESGAESENSQLPISNKKRAISIISCNLEFVNIYETLYTEKQKVTTCGGWMLWSWGKLLLDLLKESLTKKAILK